MVRIILRIRNRFTCKDCGGHNGLRSHKRTLEYLLPIFLLQPVRCADCFRRGYCSVLIPLSDMTPLDESRLVPPRTRGGSPGPRAA